MKRLALLVIAGAAACGSVPDLGGGIVALEVRTPDTLRLAVGATLTLHARALDLQGDSVAADIFWRTPDTALVTLDTVRGTIVARTNTGVARIQARVSSLVSNIIQITLSDTTAGLRRTP